MEVEQSVTNRSSSAASIRTRICMSPPSSTSMIAFSEAGASPTTRQGYRQMLAWMRSFGQLRRVGIEATGTYGAGLLRYLQNAGVEVLEVTTPDRRDRRKRGKNDDLDAQNAAHAAFAGKRTVTPKSRDGMIESLRVLKACRKTAVAATARRAADDPQHDRLRARRACGTRCAS